MPWEEGQALSVLTMAINVDATNSQTIGFPTLWSKLTNEMSGLGIKYAADHKAIDLIKPPNADQVSASYQHDSSSCRSASLPMVLVRLTDILVLAAEVQHGLYPSQHEMRHI